MYILDWDHYQVGSSIPDKGAQDNVDPEEYWDPEDPNFVVGYFFVIF